MNSLAIAQRFIEQDYSPAEYPLTLKQTEEWQQTKPLKGKRILKNVPLVKNALIKMLPLIASEVDLTVTHFNIPGLKSSQAAIDILDKLGIPFIANHELIRGEFDIGHDCGAQILSMPNVTIKEGLIELTQTGGKIYQTTATPFPVIDIDNSLTKNLEGMYGTGDGFVRAIKYHTQASLNEKSFVVFGFGKVGRGVAKYLSYQNAKITIVEVDPARLALAAKMGFNTISAENKSQVKAAIQQAFAVCTATGRKNIIKQYITPEECKNTWFANMGVTLDEIDKDFHHPKILCEGAAINFSLETPTQVKYLDPIFYAYNEATLHLANTSAGYNAFDSTADEHIVQTWQKIYNTNVADIYEQ